MRDPTSFAELLERHGQDPLGTSEPALVEWLEALRQLWAGVIRVEASRGPRPLTWEQVTGSAGHTKLSASVPRSQLGILFASADVARAVMSAYLGIAAQALGTARVETWCAPSGTRFFLKECPRFVREDLRIYAATVRRAAARWVALPRVEVAYAPPPSERPSVREFLTTDDTVLIDSPLLTPAPGDEADVVTRPDAPWRALAD